MANCTKTHRYNNLFRNLPDDQGGAGRHHCAGCAYENGYADGCIRSERLDLNLNNLPESQAGTIRHKSPHAAFALGYLHGLEEFYQ